VTGTWSRLVTPRSVGEVAEALAIDAVIIAGGTDAVPMRQAGLLGAMHLVDVAGVEELIGVSADGSDLRVGAATTMAALAGQAERLGRHRALADGASVVGSRQTRNVATIGGNICRASPSGDTLAPLLVGAGHLTLASTDGVRTMQAADFFVGPGSTQRAGHEFLVDIRFPIGDGASAYERVTVRKSMDLATVGVAVSIETDRGEHQPLVRLAVSGAGPVPILVPLPAGALAGLAARDLLAAVPVLQQAAQASISPIDDVRGSAWYRRRMVDHLIKRVTTVAIARLPEEGSVA
jgi:carbon-monoxide dehydrogenase medium subunit